MTEQSYTVNAELPPRTYPRLLLKVLSVHGNAVRFENVENGDLYGSEWQKSDPLPSSTLTTSMGRYFDGDQRLTPIEEIGGTLKPGDICTFITYEELASKESNRA